MFGRDVENAMVMEALARGRSGAPEIVLIEGEAGVGKTRLLDEMATAADFTVQHVTAAESIDVYQPDVPRPAPALMILDDVQWAPRWTLSALRTLPARLGESPAVWAIACDSGSSGHRAARLFAELADAGARRVRLRPWNRHTCAAFVGGVLGATPDANLLALTDMAAGNPGLVTHLVAGLREEDAVEITAGRARLRDKGLPRRLREFVTHRLACLSSSARHTVTVAATLGRSCTMNDLCRRMGASATELLPSVQEALDDRLLSSVDDSLVFRHELLRRAVVESLPPAVSRELERELGRAVPAEQPHVGIEELTHVQFTVTRLVAQGMTDRQIASRMRVSPHTVNFHLRRVFRALDINSRVELTRLYTAHAAQTSVASNA